MARQAPMIPRRARRTVTPCFRRPPTCGAVSATGAPLSLLTSLSPSSATTHSLPSVSGLRRRGGANQVVLAPGIRRIWER